MRKYNLQINDRDFEVVIKKVTPTDAYVEVNGQDHVVQIKSIVSSNLVSTVSSSSNHEL